MRDEGYDAETAAAITAASATIGPIIPPSLPMVIYGVSADVSIGALFLAGVVPGLLMAGVADADGGGGRAPEKPAAPPLPRRSRSVVRISPRLLGADDAAVVLFGGMITGLFTPTEAAAVAAVYALVLGLVVYRDFDLRDLPPDRRRHRRDHRRRAGARDDRGRARLVPVDLPHPADGRRRRWSRRSAIRCSSSSS